MVTAEDILLQQTSRYKQYSVVRVADDEFEVKDENMLATAGEEEDEEEDDNEILLSDHGEDNEEDGGEDDEDGIVLQTMQQAEDQHHPPIPRFIRTRTVRWDREGSFYECSCCHFERTGIPCVHIYAVVKRLDPDWKGFTHHDVSVRWWSAYISHGFLDSQDSGEDGKEESLSTRLCNLADFDAKGPSIRTLPAPMLVDVGFPTASRSTDVPAFCRVKNYAKDHLHEIFGKGDVRSTEMNLDIGLTQTTFDPDDHDDDDDDDGGGGVCNLFEESLKQISTINETLEDHMRSVEANFRRIASLLRIVDTPGRYAAVTAVSSIVSQLEDLVYKKENRKRSSSGRGTQGVVMESHTAKRRMYNTHNDYYR